jgi:DNA-binding PadR family transcriptional regulator
MRVPTPDHVILGLLAAQPQHGYDLVAHFQSPALLGRVWTMSTSQVYAVLKRLEKQGAIVGAEIETPDAPTRTEYTISRAGRAQLDRWLADPHPSASVRRIRVEFISKLHVARLLGLPLDPIVDRQRRACERQLERLRMEAGQTASPTERLSLEFAVGQLRAALDWLDRCAEMMADDRQPLDQPKVG